MERDVTKVKDLTPNTKRVNILAKVVSIGDVKTITKDGATKHVTEATVGDDTGTVVMSLWEDQSRIVAPDDTIFIGNGYITLVRGHMRLNVGKYGKIEHAEDSLTDVNLENDMSSRAFEYYAGPRSGGFGGEFSSRYGVEPSLGDYFGKKRIKPQRKKER